MCKSLYFKMYIGFFTIRIDSYNNNYGKQINQTLLHFAVAYEKFKSVEFLLRNGADRKIIDIIGFLIFIKFRKNTL